MILHDMPKKKPHEETARDILALGSLVFYFLVVARALIGPYLMLLSQLVGSLVVLIVISHFIKDHDAYLARGLILSVFVILFYTDIVFTSFVALVFFGLIASSHYLGSKIDKITKGLLLGVVSTIAGYYFALIT